MRTEKKSIGSFGFASSIGRMHSTKAQCDLPRLQSASTATIGGIAWPGCQSAMRRETSSSFVELRVWP